MPDTIQNYGDLKATVQRYINRDNQELIDEIPTFIQFGERNIFRRLRAPNNEAVTDWPAGTEGVDDYSELQVPDGYLEAKLFTMNGKPLIRKSEQEFQRLKFAGGAGYTGLPRYFARFANKFRFWPIPDFPYETTLLYWKDFSGQLIDDTSTTDFLRTIPDLYVFGACLHAEPWLKNDQRIETWSKLWNATMDGMNDQAAEAEYSGSTVDVSSVGAA